MQENRRWREKRYSASVLRILRGAASKTARLAMATNPVTNRGCNDGSSGGGNCHPPGRSHPSVVRTHSKWAPVGISATWPSCRGSTTAAQAPTVSKRSESSKMLLKREAIRCLEESFAGRRHPKMPGGAPLKSQGGVLPTFRSNPRTTARHPAFDYYANLNLQGTCAKTDESTDLTNDSIWPHRRCGRATCCLRST